MHSARKIGAFAVDPREEFIVAGTMAGEAVVIDVDDLVVRGRLCAHTGSIEAVAVHASLPYVATLSMDRSVSVLERTSPSSLTLVDRFSFRDVRCWNDPGPVPYNYSLSQALAFHPTSKRLATRSGNAGVLELDFSTDRLELIHCTRLHGDTDLITVRYVDDDGTLISGAGGDAVLSRTGIKLRSWNLGRFNLHWFEPVGDAEYLIACDELNVIRLDLKDRYAPILGQKLTRDDLEHVTFNATSKRAFAGGFDGTVYEIDPETCNVKRIAWNAPYKLRWMKTLEREPDTLLVHCFNGALYKVGLSEQRVLARIKETPNAVWTCVREGETLFFAGEGHAVRPVHLTGVDPTTAFPLFEPGAPLGKPERSYTKRMVGTPSGLLLAERGGHLLRLTDAGSSEIADLAEELRDVAVVPDGSIAFACTERGRVMKVDTATGDVLDVYESPRREPIWSLAYHPAREVLAFAERRGTLVVVDARTFRVLFSGSRSSRPKRMKWCGDTLVYVQTAALEKFDLATGQVADYVADCGNTVEDFIWDDARQYLVLVGYRTEIVLCDFATGDKLSIVPDQADFSKGLAWVNPRRAAGAYPLDFVTFGRSGTAHLYRIHNERCLAMGPIAPRLI